MSPPLAAAAPAMPDETRTHPASEARAIPSGHGNGELKLDDEDQASEFARSLRRACKSKFFKQVDVDAVAEVVADARAAGLEPQDFINLGNENTKTALMFASQLNRSIELVRFLIENGADVNQSTNRGHTPLFYAASKGRNQVVRVLLEHGAWTRVINVNGATPRSSGRGKLEPAVMELLRARELSEGQDWVDWTGDPQAIEAQKKHAMSCRNCRRTLGIETTPRTSGGRGHGELGDWVLVNGDTGGHDIDEDEPAIFSSQYIPVSPADAVADAVASSPSICCGNGAAEEVYHEQVLSEITRALLTRCFGVMAASGTRRRELSLQFRSDAESLCDSLLEDTACARGAVLLQMAGMRARVQKEVAPHIKGRRMMNLHSMIEGALIASLSRHPAWLHALGPRRLFAVTDSETAVAVLRTAALQDTGSSSEDCRLCACAASLGELDDGMVLERAEELAVASRAWEAVRLLQFFADDTDAWAESARRVASCAARQGQFDAVEELFSARCPVERQGPLRIQALADMLEIAEESNGTAHGQIKAAMRLGSAWGLIADAGRRAASKSAAEAEIRLLTERLEVCILREMLARGDYDRAMLYADQFEHLLPHLPDPPEDGSSSVTNGFHATQDTEYLLLDLPMSSVVFIDTVDGLRSATAELASRAELACREKSMLRVGLDTEWRDPRPQSSLVQVALPDKVWLVDTCTPLRADGLQASEYECALQGFLTTLFTLARDHRISLLGFSFAADVGHLTALGIPDDLKLNEYITDVQALCQERLSLGYAPSLSAAASLVLGRPIDKRQQCSNWERRPLSQAQVAYAAIDAHVLLKLAESLLDTEE